MNSSSKGNGTHMSIPYLWVSRQPTQGQGLAGEEYLYVSGAGHSFLASKLASECCRTVTNEECFFKSTLRFIEVRNFTKLESWLIS